MAVTVVTPVALAMNTASASTTDAAGCIVPTVAADGWSITPGTKHAIQNMIVKFLAPAGGDTITVKAGTRPPAMLAELGDLAIVLTANQVKYVVLEGARFQKSDGTILIIPLDVTSKCGAFLMPDGQGGGTGNT